NRDAGGAPRRCARIAAAAGGAGDFHLQRSRGRVASRPLPYRPAPLCERPLSPRHGPGQGWRRRASCCTALLATPKCVTILGLEETPHTARAVSRGLMQTNEGR